MYFDIYLGGLCSARDELRGTLVRRSEQRSETVVENMNVAFGL